MLKLGDFGSAHFIEMESTMDASAVPAYGSKGVTMLYAAPETHTGGFQVIYDVIRTGILHLLHNLYSFMKP